MKKFVIKELILYFLSAVALYLASFFHFYGPSMWYKGAIPESWEITTKFVAAYAIFILLYLFLTLRIKGRLLATAVTTISAGLLLPWMGYSILSVVDISGGGSGITVYLSWFMSAVSDIAFLVLLFLGRKFVIDNTSKK